MLDCPNAFEIYLTEDVAVSPYENTLYGEISPVTYPHNTLETTNRERITWLYNKNEIWTASETENKEVVKTQLMKVALQSSN